MTTPDPREDRCGATRPARLDQSVVDVARRLAHARLTPLPRRWAHTIGVAAAAQQLSRDLAPAGRVAVTAAAWLHDIGYAPTLVDTGFHPLDGARFLRHAGFHPVVVSLVAHHTGADSEAYERGLFAELGEFPYVLRPVLDVLTTADLTTSPDGSPRRAGRPDRRDPVPLPAGRSGAPRRLALPLAAAGGGRAGARTLPRPTRRPKAPPLPSCRRRCMT